MANRKRQKRTEDSKETKDKIKKSRRNSISDEEKTTFDSNEIDTQEDSPLTSKTTQSGNAKKSRTPRGRTQMHCLAIQRAQGVKKTVQFNHHGQPIGKESKNLASYIGVLAREKVKITYAAWPEVPEDVKNCIWASVNLVYNVPPTWKERCLSSAGSKWKQFKSKLTKKWVYGRLNSPKLNKPPKQYVIDKDDWSAFVISRLGEDFKQLSQEQSKRRTGAKDYPYRLGRQGYARYAEEHPEILCDDEDLNQATLWVEGRKNKEGAHEGEKLKETVARIDNFKEMKKTGKLVTTGSKDNVLSQALEKGEHPGRVRGRGSNVTIKSYFHAVRSNVHKELLEERKKNFEINARIDRLEVAMCKLGAFGTEAEEKGSCSVRVERAASEDEIEIKKEPPKNETEGDDDGDDLKLVENDEYLQGKSVALTLASTTNVAAYGMVLKKNGRNDVVHGKKLPDKCVRVSIDEAIDKNARLPFPTPEMESVGDAVGSYVAWPIHLMKVREQKPQKKKKERPKPTLDPSSVPNMLYMLYVFSKATMNQGGNITIILNEDVFGHEKNLYIHFEDIDPFCRLLPISGTCISVYIWLLYKKLMDEDMTDKYRFVDHESVGYLKPIREEKKLVDENMEKRARALAARMVGTHNNQLVIVPCNVDEHWILTVINPHKEIVHLLDPLYHGIKDVLWEKVVNLSLKILNAEIGRKGRKHPIWEVIKAPKQPDGFQCGFYVSRYMKQLIESRASADMDSLQPLFTGVVYTKADIDEVRNEWANCVQDNIIV